MARRRFSISKPLVLPTSTVVVECYASHGKGFSGSPEPLVPIRILGVNEKQLTRWDEGHLSK